MENKVQLASDLFAGGLLCSQAILITYGERFGVDEETATRIARPFGGGVSRMCEMCGAVSGAFMVLGLKHEGEDEKAVKEANYKMVQEFASRFKEKHGSINCRELLGCDLGTPEGQEFFRQNGRLGLCRSFVKDSAELLEEFLAK